MINKPNNKYVNLHFGTDRLKDIYDELERVQWILNYNKKQDFIYFILEDWLNVNRGLNNAKMIEKILFDKDEEEQIDTIQPTKTKYKKIYLKKGKYEVYYRKHYIGRFETIEEALNEQREYIKNNNLNEYD